MRARIGATWRSVVLRLPSREIQFSIVFNLIRHNLEPKIFHPEMGPYDLRTHLPYSINSCIPAHLLRWYSMCIGYVGALELKLELSGLQF